MRSRRPHRNLLLRAIELYKPLNAHRYLTEAEKLLASGARANAQTS